ncbi:N-acyl homoserine lactonase family protein [Pseudoroseomonas cervicalis]|uniref:Metallo-beta-lactamase domain protein n=1 Tax=Pseudoroseomonas cervicalis ATCC 49957 TaxID=525371 RepID=D5RN36_9PROT|nr:N-acyl homoserine lactonase family protein [Pseudoroseomonas cervicalis]EFH11303.1 metallo-beta-lactamase domain protein [Pseudoroseomonas cervicalis ATCC 49957]
MTETPTYEVFALRYATREARRAEHFIGGDPHDGPMPMDYFVWLIRGADRCIVVDSGFTAEVAARRKRTHLRDPIDALRLLGCDAGTVQDVVLTHLHYDHVGNFHRFPVAQFHLQEADLHFACGRHMRHGFLRHSFEVEDVVGIVRLNYAERVRLYTGPVELAPGITLHPAPGHSAGLQFVRVNTARGAVVLASDVTHFYENMETGRPFPTCVSIADSLESQQRLREAAPSPAHIVPGHDPEVMRRYPAVSPALEGIAVRLDVAPREAGA